MNDQVSANQALRYRRLAFYANDIEQLNQLLLAYVKKSGAHSVLLIDKDGHLVAKQGFTNDLESTSLSALVAGSFATTREVARQLGESEFEVLFHQGKNQSIHIKLIGDRTLQVSVFNKDAKSGMIQVMAKELGKKVGDVIDEIANRKPEESGEQQESLDEGFSSEMKNHLDDLFGDL